MNVCDHPGINEWYDVSYQSLWLASQARSRIRSRIGAHWVLRIVTKLGFLSSGSITKVFYSGCPPGPVTRLRTWRKAMVYDSPGFMINNARSWPQGKGWSSTMVDGARFHYRASQVYKCCPLLSKICGAILNTSNEDVNVWTSQHETPDLPCRIFLLSVVREPDLETRAAALTRELL